MLPALRAVLLDLDGTLIDRDAALRACLRHHGVPGEALEQLPRFVTPNPAISASLMRLTQAGLRLALISNGGPTQRLKLAAARIDPAHFEIIHISGEQAHAKPDRAVFKSTLSALDLPASATLMIGDSANDDILGAQTLDIPTLWISHNRRYPANRVAPTLIAPDFPSAAAIVLAKLA